MPVQIPWQSEQRVIYRFRPLCIMTFRLWLLCYNLFKDVSWLFCFMSYNAFHERHVAVLCLSLARHFRNWLRHLCTLSSFDLVVSPASAVLAAVWVTRALCGPGCVRSVNLF